MGSEGETQPAVFVVSVRAVNQRQLAHVAVGWVVQRKIVNQGSSMTALDTCMRFSMITNCLAFKCL